jgi:hypothetical protein
MALEWIANYQAMVGKVGTSLMVPGSSDYYAQNGNREYFINRDEADDQQCGTAGRGAGNRTRR